MAATLKIDNYGSLNLVEGSQLDADYASGVAVFAFKSTKDYAANDILVFGQRATDACEKLIILSIAGQNVTTTANSKQGHKRFESVVSLFGDQIKVYRAPNVDGSQPADGAFSYLNTVTIDVDQPSSQYVDSGGGSGYWYKFTYYNSITTQETALADSQAARGGGYGHYATVDDIRQEAGFTNNVNISDNTINSARIDAEGEIDSEVVGIYTLPFASPTPRLVNEITRLIAAGIMLLKEYGSVSSGTNKEGNDKLKQGRDLLAKVKTREKIVTDLNGNSLVLTTAGVVTSWPNSTTKDQTEADHGGDVLFNIKHQF